MLEKLKEEVCKANLELVAHGTVIFTGKCLRNRPRKRTCRNQAFRREL